MLDELQAPLAVSDETAPVLEWARRILSQAVSLKVEDCQPVAPRAGRRWRWAP